MIKNGILVFGIWVNMTYFFPHNHKALSPRPPFIFPEFYYLTHLTVLQSYDLTCLTILRS